MLHALGRFIFGGFFAYNGINHFKQVEGMAQYAAAKGVTEPRAAVLGSGAMLLAGGTSLMLGLRPKMGAGLVTLFLLGVTPKMHDYWKQEDPAQRQSEMINFYKNVALLGAALAILGVGHDED